MAKIEKEDLAAQITAMRQQCGMAQNKPNFLQITCVEAQVDSKFI